MYVRKQSLITEKKMPKLLINKRPVLYPFPFHGNKTWYAISMLDTYRFYINSQNIKIPGTANGKYLITYYVTGSAS